MKLKYKLIRIILLYFIFILTGCPLGFYDYVGTYKFTTVKKFIIPNITSDVNMEGYKNGYINITNIIFYFIQYEVTNYTNYVPFDNPRTTEYFYLPLKPIFSLASNKVLNIIFSEGVLMVEINDSVSIRSIPDSNLTNRSIKDYDICGYLTNKDKIYPIYYQYCGNGERLKFEEERNYLFRYYINNKEEQLIESICEYDFDNYWEGLNEEEMEILNKFTNIIKRKQIKLNTIPNPIKLIGKEIKQTNDNEYIVKIMVEYSNEVDVRWLSSLPEYKGYPVLMYTWVRNNVYYPNYDSSELIKDIVKTTNGWTNTIELWIRDITNNNGGTHYYEGVANDLFGMVVISDKNDEKICLGVPVGR